MRTFITASTTFTPLEVIDQPVIEIEDGKIVSIGSNQSRELPADAKVMDFGEAILAPGFIDIHVHGGAGYDVMSADDDGLAKFEQHLAGQGVTSYCPTTVTAPLDQTLASLERIGKSIQSRTKQPYRALPLGVHLEGPFLSHAKRGVHPPTELKEASVELFKRFFDAAQSQILLMTVAPEIPGACEMIDFANRLEICISLGHSNATAKETRAAIEAGARHATHTFNAMRALDHRDPGILGTVLSSDSMTADIIADGLHVDPAVISLFLRAKGHEHAVLITDAISATGMGDGKFKLGNLEVQVTRGRCEHDGKLAGSVLTMECAIRNICNYTEWSLQQAIRLATLNPASVLGMVGRKGLLTRGADADLVVLTPAGEVIQTIVGGEV